jgi:hypothetical protein
VVCSLRSTLISVLMLPCTLSAASGLPLENASAVQAKSDTANSPSSAGMVVDITLERKKEGKIEAMAAGHIFAVGDIIRLKLVSHYDGFLYVMEQGSSGKFSTVFPAVQTGSDNRVLRTKQYLVPAVEDGWFEVNGPAGFDVLYFLLSPTALAPPSLSSFAAPGPVSSLKPRCNDEIFRARGDCTDDSAGPAAVAPGQVLPGPLVPLAGSASRDITFTSKSDGTVGVMGESHAPMLYTFRLAHL